MIDPRVLAIATALGVGLLVGLEREKSKGTGPGRAPAGVRTFALLALAGALAALAGGPWLAAAGLLLAGSYGVVAYLRDRSGDPGLTTEIAMPVVYLAGALAVASPAIAGGVGVATAIVLASRSRLHDFVHDRLTDRELTDGLLLAAAALVVLPLLPDRAVDPWGVFNPRVIWLLAVLVMAINAAGYVALRTLGVRFGLPAAGLAAGFVSSTATHGAMGSRARADPACRPSAVAGAALSSVATVIQLALVLGVTHPPMLSRLSLPLVLSGAGAVAWGAAFTWRSIRSTGDASVAPGRAFQWRTALAFTATVSLVLLVAALLNDRLGSAGGVAGVVIAGLADAHAAAASGASLARGGALPGPTAALAVLGAFTVNSAGKVIVAYATGGAPFGHRVAPGIALMVALAWAGAALTGLLAR